jgi:hypothetical protein
VLERSRNHDGLLGAPPHLAEPAHDPGGSRKVAVAFEQPPTVELRKTPQPLSFQLLEGEMQLGEVLLDARVGQIGELLGAERINDRTELAHDSSSNMCSKIRVAIEGLYERRHISG